MRAEQLSLRLVVKVSGDDAVRYRVLRPEADRSVLVKETASAVELRDGWTV